MVRHASLYAHKQVRRCYVNFVGDFIAALDEILADESFLLPSPVAEVSRKAACSLKDWIAGNTTTETTIKFLSSMQRYITKAVCHVNSVSTKFNAGRGKMWSTYYKIRISPTFRHTWCDFFKQTIGSIPPPNLYQHITDLLLGKMVERHVDGIVPINSKEDSTESMTRIEECALRYAAGYVCKHLVDKLKKSSHPSKDKLIWCLHKLEIESYGEGEPCNDDSTAWVESIDRGGLWHVSGSVYPVFYAMEEETRRHVRNMNTQHTLDVKGLTDAITSNEDILFYWSIASADFGQEEESILLQDITKLWITVRGFAYVSGWVEQYKQLKGSTLQKKKALRKNLETASCT